jgi:hypothetical protein
MNDGPEPAGGASPEMVVLEATTMPKMIASIAESAGQPMHGAS